MKLLKLDASFLLTLLFAQQQTKPQNTNVSNRSNTVPCLGGINADSLSSNNAYSFAAKSYMGNLIIV